MEASPFGILPAEIISHIFLLAVAGGDAQAASSARALPLVCKGLYPYAERCLVHEITLRSVHSIESLFVALLESETRGRPLSPHARHLLLLVEGDEAPPRSDMLESPALMSIIHRLINLTSFTVRKY